MENLLEVLQENPNALKLSEHDVVKYNAVLSNPEEIKRKGGAVLYSIYSLNVETNYFHAQNINAWGVYLEESGKLSDVSPRQ